MNFKTRRILGIFLKIIAIGFAITGVVLSYVLPWGNGFMSGPRTFLYFTTDCNVLISLFYFVSIGFNIRDLLKGEEKKHKLLDIINHVFTIGMTLTCLCFYGMIIQFLFSEDIANNFAFIIFPSNWTVHFAAPGFVLLNYFICEKPIDKEDEKVYSLYSLILPIIYATAIYILSFNGMMFGDGSQKVPYFFMDYETIPIYLLIPLYIVVAIALYFLSILLVFIQKKIFTKLNREKN